MIDGKAPPAIGYILDIAGLSIPGILPSINRLPAIDTPTLEIPLDTISEIALCKSFNCSSNTTPAHKDCG